MQWVALEHYEGLFHLIMKQQSLTGKRPCCLMHYPDCPALNIQMSWCCLSHSSCQSWTFGPPSLYQISASSIEQMQPVLQDQDGQDAGGRAGVGCLPWSYLWHLWGLAIHWPGLRCKHWVDETTEAGIAEACHYQPVLILNCALRTLPFH